MTISHDYGLDNKDYTEIEDLWIIRSELQSSLDKLDELIKQKEWERGQ